MLSIVFRRGTAMTDLAALRSANARRWAGGEPDAQFLCRRQTSRRARGQVPLSVRYRRVTGVPWAAIAVIHERECSQDWKGSLAQGDPWDRVSVHVPAGQGPLRIVGRGRGSRAE